MGIFSENAPRYWDAGLPVIPLKKWNSPAKGRGKAPILNEWTTYADTMPSKALRDMWIQAYEDNNIGLPFGPASGLCAIDIDTEDEELVKAIVAALPVSPWRRIGKKGMGLIYRWNGQPNFKLRNAENESIVEFLGRGNQMVMPPSIHPDTEKPYVSDTNLWEQGVLDKVPGLPVDIEQVLRQALNGVEGLTLSQTTRTSMTRVVPQGERDIQLVRMAGYLARVVEGIDKSVEYSLKEAMDQIYVWVEKQTADVAGDDMDPDKGVQKLIEFLLKDVEGGRTLPNGWDVGLDEEALKHPGIAEIARLNVVQRWDAERALTWLESQMLNAPGDRKLFLSKVQELIGLVARDENFTDLEFRTLAGWIVDMKVVKISKPDLTRAWKEARAGDVAMAEDHEAVAREVLEVAGRGGEIRFNNGSFWQWSGACFQLVSNEEMYRTVASQVKNNPLVRRHNDYVAVVSCMSRLSEKPLVEKLESGVNFANGFLTADGVLNDHSPKYGCTYVMPFEYIPERATECHKWLAYLEQAWGDDEDYAEKVMALQEAFAATMFGLAWQYQRCFLLFGKAGAGKSQALEVLSAMLPEEAQTSLSPEKWGERFQAVALLGKILNVCGELPEESVISGKHFKEIVEGKNQSTEFKGRDLFDFKPIAAHWFGSNFLPRTKDTTKGFTRRWQIFEFNREVPVNERITEFHRVLVSEEREAIAAWAVQGLGRLLKQGDYTQPSSHLRRVAQMTRANNSVAAFIETSDKVRRTPDGRADLRNVFDYYVDHMKTVARGWSVTIDRFRMMIEECDLVVEDYYDGVGALRQEIVGLEMKGALLPPGRDLPDFH